MKGSSWLGGLASLISIGAGLYLLTSSSASVDTTVFDVLMHGIGAYCVARGVWMMYELTAAAARVGSQEQKPSSMLGKSFRLTPPQQKEDS